jgi:hypothetical protein
MSPVDNFIKCLLAEAKDPASLRQVQQGAARRFYAYNGETCPEAACAITLSLLLQRAGLDIEDVFHAFHLTETLVKKGWSEIPVGNQRPGDIGTTCGDWPRHGADQIYLVVETNGDDEMVVVDCQQPTPHVRFASRIGTLIGGKRKPPTTYFLRAQAIHKSASRT